MLRELRLRNVAIVERLDLEFPDGLIALTGETGAGKSIIVGALGLALGERARPEHQRTPGEESLVEALFTGPLPRGVRTRLEAAGVPATGDLLLRRVVSPGGRSRAFANDTAITLPTLEEIGRELVDIHGQHQHQSLLHAETHLDFLDGFARLLGVRERYREVWTRLDGLGRERDLLERQEAERERRLEYLRFQHDELERAALQPGEEEHLRSERDILRNVDRLAVAVGEAEALAYSAEASASGQAGGAARRLAEAALVDPSLLPLATALAGAQAALEDAGREMQDYLSRLEADPARLGEIDDRLALITRLKKKYGPTVEAVLAEAGVVQAEITRLEQGSARLAGLDREIAAASAAAGALAAELSRGREAAGPKLAKRILEELAALAMGGCSFEVRLQREEDPAGRLTLEGRRWRADERGIEKAEFLLSANPGVELRPLARVASGGELSRVMLALKTALAQVDRVPTLVFDEVDIGIGGRTARTVGERLRAVAAGRQVFCVTHLPQIASLAHVQYTIEKRVVAGRTRVRVQRLDGPGRVAEVARMLGGHAVTEATLHHAEELLLGDGSA
ncbi:MAG: DNA repair protein RecN [Candidatus Methylomirabilia bacterium]